MSDFVKCDKKLNKKQIEWNEQAASTECAQKQVCRPVNATIQNELIADIKRKLLLTSPCNFILDVGCGNACILSGLANHFHQVAGIDFSENMIKKAKERLPDGLFKHAEAADINFGDQSFDRVLSYSIFHYFKDEYYAFSVMNQMMRVCKKGGIILIGDLLDQKFEDEIKSSSNLDYEQKIPLIQRYSQWLFYDLERLKQNALDHGAVKVEILEQPRALQCSHYRKDLRIWL